MKYYNIAGITIEDCATELADLDGFATFQIAPQYASSLQLRIIKEQDINDLTQYVVLYADDFSKVYRPKAENTPLTAVILPNSAASPADRKFNAWLYFGAAALTCNTVSLHASSVLYKGKTYLFLGESGTGKSTHTSLWTKYIPNAELFNDDSPFIRISESGILACGSPWSGKTPCYRNIEAPLAALVRIRRAPFNKAHRLNALHAIGAVLPSCPPAFADNTLLASKIHETVSNIIINTPVYILDCKPEPQAALLMLNELSPQP